VIDRSQVLSPSASRLLVPLGGTQRLFLKVQPSPWRIARLIVATGTYHAPLLFPQLAVALERRLVAVF
jgi:hypothetical protein